MGKRFNLKYIPSPDPNFPDIVADGSSWVKKETLRPWVVSPTIPAESVPGARKTAGQKVTHLNMTLGQVAN